LNISRYFRPFYFHQTISGQRQVAVLGSAYEAQYGNFRETWTAINWAWSSRATFAAFVLGSRNRPLLNDHPPSVFKIEGFASCAFEDGWNFLKRSFPLTETAAVPKRCENQYYKAIADEVEIFGTHTNPTWQWKPRLQLLQNWPLLTPTSIGTGCSLSFFTAFVFRFWVLGTTHFLLFSKFCT
jgi:hypothetical protein